MSAPGITIITLSVSFVFVCFDIWGQNLVPNPGFEEYAICPGNYTRGTAELHITAWWSAGRGTPDHFHACSRGEAGIPHNWAGVSEAWEGHGYAGIYVWMNDPQTNYREYLQCKLLEPLQKDSLYNLEFHFKLSSYSKYATDRMGILLTDTAVMVKHDKVILCEPSFSMVSDSALTTKTGYWEIARQVYRARGGEQYLTIGNFAGNKATEAYYIQHRSVQQTMLANSAYYYIDEIKVEPKFLPAAYAVKSLVPVFGGEETTLNTTYVLDNINFEFNSYRLTPSSFETLDQLVAWLTEHPRIRVQLAGHTDDVGGDRYNLALSQNRSKSVAAYLIAQGVQSNRIESFGYGKSRPLLDSKDEPARRINRRVEVKFLE